MNQPLFPNEPGRASEIRPAEIGVVRKALIAVGIYLACLTVGVTLASFARPPAPVVVAHDRTAE